MMGTCTSGVQPAKEGEYVGCGFTHGGTVCDGGPVCLGYNQQRKVSMLGVVLHMVALYVMGTCMSGVQPAKEGECVVCGFTHGGTV